MALTVVNDTNPIKVTGTTDAATTIFDGKILVKRVYWFNPTTAADLCTLKDQDGNDILPMRCEVDATSQFFDFDIYFNGITCDDMDSGTLYIYTR